MTKNKIVLVASCIFSAVFLGYIFKMGQDLSRVEDIIASSPNVVDVTDKIQTKLLVTAENFKNDAWAAPEFEDKSWTSVAIPKHRIVSEKEFNEGNFAYYRIYVPRTSFKSLSTLQNQLSVSLQYVQFSSMDIYLNGKFFRTLNPIKSVEFMTNLPIEDRIDNLIAIKGSIKTGDSGVNHRGKILVGKGVELNELYNKAYKSTTVRGLIYLLCKGSILFVFTLLFLVLRVESFFEKSLLYAMFVILEDILTGDYVYGILSLNQQVYLYDFVNLGINIFLFLFVSEVIKSRISLHAFKLIILLVAGLSVLISVDLLHTSIVFNIDSFLKFWNLVFIVNLLWFLPKLFKQEKVFFAIALTAATLTIWGGLFTSNFSMNLKAYGNLLIFFGVAYQTFILFRREQIQLFEQEKDVAIGKTAAMLAHDVRKPLEQVKVLLDRLVHGDHSEEFLEIAKHDIGFSLMSVESHVNDIINYSSFKKIDLNPVSIYSVLSTSINQVLSLGNMIDLELNYDFKANTKILADESRLAIIFNNILSNAVEAIQDIGKSDKGEIRVSTDVYFGKFRIKISNTGPQIPEELLNEIFKPLITYGKATGTGLGLASVSKAVQELNGEIFAKNLHPSGVEFEMQFQVSEVFDSADQYVFQSKLKSFMNLASNRVTPSDLKSIRVLVLEEDPKIFEYYSEIVHGMSSKYEVLNASTEKDCRRLLASKHFDLVLANSSFEFLEPLIKEHVTFIQFYGSNRIDERKIISLITIDELTELCSKASNNAKRILLVEDSKIITLGWLMYYGKHNLMCVSNPDDAISFLETHQNIDVCVIDYHFEGFTMNGVELADYLIKENYTYNMVISSSKLDICCDYRVIPKGAYKI